MKLIEKFWFLVVTVFVISMKIEMFVSQRNSSCCETVTILNVNTDDDSLS